MHGWYPKLVILMKLASNAIIAKNVPANHCPQITVTAKLVLYINIYFCAPLIPLEMSISKKTSLFKSCVCVFSPFCCITISSVAYNPLTYVPLQETFEQTDGAWNGVTALFIQLALVPAHMTHLSAIGPHSQWVNQNYMQKQFITCKSTAAIGQFDSGSALEGIQLNLQTLCFMSIAQFFAWLKMVSKSVIIGLNKILALLDRLYYHYQKCYLSLLL